MAQKTKRMAREDRHQELIHIACELFAEKGYDATTLKDIADRAGVSKALMSQHFESKDEIYMVLFQQWAVESRYVIRFNLSGKSIMDTLHSVADLLIYHSEEASALAGRDALLEKAILSRPSMSVEIANVRRNGSDIVSDSILPLIRLGQASGELRDGDPHTLADLFWSVCVTKMRQRTEYPDRFYTPTVDFLFELLARPADSARP